MNPGWCFHLPFFAPLPFFFFLNSCANTTAKANLGALVTHL